MYPPLLTLMASLVVLAIAIKGTAQFNGGSRTTVTNHQENWVFVVLLGLLSSCVAAVVICINWMHLRVMWLMCALEQVAYTGCDSATVKGTLLEKCIGNNDCHTKDLRFHNDDMNVTAGDMLCRAWPQDMCTHTGLYVGKENEPALRLFTVLYAVLCGVLCGVLCTVRVAGAS